MPLNPIQIIERHPVYRKVSVYIPGEHIESSLLQRIMGVSFPFTRATGSLTSLFSPDYIKSLEHPAAAGCPEGRLGYPSLILYETGRVSLNLTQDMADSLGFRGEKITGGVRVLLDLLGPSWVKEQERLQQVDASLSILWPGTPPRAPGSRSWAQCEATAAVYLKEISQPFEEIPPSGLRELFSQQSHPDLITKQAAESWRCGERSAMMIQWRGALGWRSAAGLAELAQQVGKHQAVLELEPFPTDPCPVPRRIYTRDDLSLSEVIPRRESIYMRYNGDWTII